MRKKLTIQDVARLAGVSKATASRVLNGKSSVDPVLRERVLQVAREHEFVPSINALGLNGRSQLLGVLMPRYLWAALQEMLQIISCYISTETRYEIILYSCSREDGYDRVIQQIVQTNLIAGLIATLYDQSPAYLEKLYEQGLPVILLNTSGVETGLPTIGADYYTGAYEAVHYLLTLGHRRIGYIHGPQEWPRSQDCYRAYCDALRDCDVEPEAGLFLQGDGTSASGTRAAHTLLALEEAPTAIFASNDDMAYGTVIAAQERHIHIPDELSVIGFNDDPVPAVRSMLTTVHQPFADMARCASELLVAMLQPDHCFSPQWQEIMATTTNPLNVSTCEDIAMPCNIHFPTHLVIRNSCAAISVKKRG